MTDRNGSSNNGISKAAKDYCELYQAAAIVNNGRPSIFSKCVRRCSGIEKVPLESNAPPEDKTLAGADGDSSGGN